MSNNQHLEYKLGNTDTYIPAAFRINEEENINEEETEISETDSVESTLDWIVRNYKGKINWCMMSKNKMTPEFIEKHIDKLHMKELSSNASMTPKLIEKYFEKLDKYELSTNPSLTPELIEKYFELLDNYRLSANPSLTPELMEKYMGRYSWFWMSANPSLTLELMEKYQNKVKFEKIAVNFKMTDEFLEKYGDKLFYGYLMLNSSMTPYLVEKYCAKQMGSKHRMNKDTYLKGYFRGEYGVNPSLAMRYLNLSDSLADLEKLIREDRHINWDYLSCFPLFSVDLIEKYIVNVCWPHVSNNPSLTREFIRDHADRLNWNVLSGNSLCNT